MKTKSQNQHLLLDSQQWQDLFFRHYFGDSGLYPINGAWSASPDIIPVGDKPLDDPSQLIADNNWGQDYGSSTTASQSNYIYLRGQNLATKNQTGKLYLYYSAASLLLWPKDFGDTRGWGSHPLSTSQGGQYISVSANAGARFFSPQPFQWIPIPISGDHYCLIGRVETTDNPNPIPEIGTLNDFAQYISAHPNLAWRNVSTLNPTSMQSNTQVDYDQGEEGGDVIVNLKVLNAPNGAAVSFNCGTPGPNPLISKPTTTVVNPDPPQTQLFTLALNTNIPANWRSNITFTYYSNNLAPLPGFSLTLDVIMPTADNHPLVHLSRPLHELGVNMRQLKIGPTRGIRLGSQTARGPVISHNDARLLLGTAGFPRTALEPGKSSVYFSGVSWGERSESVLASSIAGRDVSVSRVPVKDIETEQVTLSTAIQDSEPSADLTMDGDFNSGTSKGQIIAVLKTTGVPKGCQVWFKNLDGAVSIGVPPSQVNTEPVFTVTTFAELPDSGYTAKMRLFLKLNGQTLPQGWSMQFDISALPAGTVAKAEQSKPVVLINESGPTKAVLLGRVTIS